MSDITIKIDIQNQAIAKEMVAKFFAKKKISYDADSFTSDDWSGRYRFIDNPDFGKDEDAAQWVLEITFTDRPFWAKQVVIEPEIQKFFLGV